MTISHHSAAEQQSAAVSSSSISITLSHTRHSRSLHGTGCEVYDSPYSNLSCSYKTYSSSASSPFTCEAAAKQEPASATKPKVLTNTHSAPNGTSCFSSSESRKCGFVLLLPLPLGEYRMSIANANDTAPKHGSVHPLPLVTRAATWSRGQLACYWQMSDQ